MSSDPHDDLAGRWLDDESDAAPFPGLNSVPEWSDEQRLRAADVLWIDALLQTAYHPSTPADQRRIDRVLSAVRVDSETLEKPTVASRDSIEPPPVRVYRRRWYWSGAAVAAGMLLSLFLLRGQSPQAQAVAALKAAEESALLHVDRKYEATIVLAESLAGLEHRAELYVHGGEKFVMRFPTPVGDAWLGGRQGQVWFVPPVKLLPVRVSNRPELLDQWMSEGRIGVSQPFLQISAVLARFRDDYEAESVESTWDESTQRPVLQLRFKARPGVEVWPPTAELWIDANDGMVLRARHLGDSSDPWPLKSLTFQFVEQYTSENPLPADWYDHAGHHAPLRPVLRDSAP